MPKRIDVSRLTASYGDQKVVESVTLSLEPGQVTAIIGPSGCGKSTFLRSINRLHELTHNARIAGRVFMDGVDLYGPDVDPVEVRREIGMVFQRPNPFPTMSIADNVLAGVRLNRGKVSRSKASEIVERALREANLWEQVKDRLNRPGTELSGGQQQRLCIARAIAVEPEVLLMDEPCSALDQTATLAIEELITRLKLEYTVVVVTHNLAQAARISERTAYFNTPEGGGAGRLVDVGPTRRVLATHTVPVPEDPFVAARAGALGSMRSLV